ncbi:hypothetical protein ABW21_db0206135 [Orbilia brochopaga]|nr:hypothetical protein ABW21_db0206135 [Drechslerella brochopaga]
MPPNRSRGSRSTKIPSGWTAEQHREFQAMCGVIDLRPASNTGGTPHHHRLGPPVPAAQQSFRTAAQADPTVQPYPRLIWQPVTTPTSIEAAAQDAQQALENVSHRASDVLAPGTDEATGATEISLPSSSPPPSASSSSNPFTSSMDYQALAMASKPDGSPEPVSQSVPSAAGAATAAAPLTPSASTHSMSVAPRPVGPVMGHFPAPAGSPPPLPAGAGLLARAPHPRAQQFPTPAATVATASAGGQTHLQGPQGQGHPYLYRSQIQTPDPTNFLESNGLVYFRPPLQAALDGPQPSLNPALPSTVRSLVTPAASLDLAWLYQPAVWHNCAGDILVIAHPPSGAGDNAKHFVDRYKRDNVMIFAMAVTLEAANPAQEGEATDAEPLERYSAFGLNWGPLGWKNEASVACPILTEKDTMCAQIKATVNALRVLNWQAYGYSSVTVIIDSLRLLALITQKDRLEIVNDEEALLLKALVNEIMGWEARGVTVKFWMVDEADLEGTRKLAESAWIPNNLSKQGFKITADWEFTANGQDYRWTGYRWLPRAQVIELAAKVASVQQTDEAAGEQ